MIFIWLLILACGIQAQESEPLNHTVTNRCRSDKSGSTPLCWNDQDWEAFCKRVECKPQPKEITQWKEDFTLLELTSTTKMETSFMAHS